jgi:esterase/lipase superfamily enzyme
METIMDYVFCARNTSGGQFGSNSGPTKFLEVPANAATHTPGMAISKTAWFAKVAGEAEVRRTESGAPVGDVLIYIHGFNTDLSTVLLRHRLLRKGLKALGFKGTVVSFDWPSADFALNYLEDRTDAKLTAIRLVSDGVAPLAAFMRQDCEISVHVLAHSMGAFVLREALDDADDRRALVTTGWSLSQVMICAGDVSADSMGPSAVSSSLYRHCVRLTNYSNPFDAVLSISNAKRVGVSPRVGRIGLPANAPSKAVNVDCGLYYDEHREEFAHVTNSDHGFYFSSPTFIKDVYLTLMGEIDRASIPTRFADSSGRLHLLP